MSHNDPPDNDRDGENRHHDFHERGTDDNIGNASPMTQLLPEDIFYRPEEHLYEPSTFREQDAISDSLERELGEDSLWEASELEDEEILMKDDSTLPPTGVHDETDLLIQEESYRGPRRHWPDEV